MDIKKINSEAFDDETEKILSNLEKTRKNFWNLERESANFLNMLIKISCSKNVLEIGTSNGYSGIWILNALKQTKGKLTTIEYWEKRQSIARKNFSLLFPDSKVEAKIGAAIVVLEDLADEIKRNEREKFDFVFIDASKKEYLEYFNLLDNMVCDNAVILADNILSHYQKVENYVNALFNNKNYQSQIIELGSGMMISRKTKSSF